MKTENKLCDLIEKCRCYLTMDKDEKATVCRQNPEACGCREYALARIPITRRQYIRPMTRELAVIKG